jgi:hypothetical protein
MISLSVVVAVPQWHSRFKNIWCISGATLWPHKFWEIQLFNADCLLKLNFDLSIQQDHAGTQLELALAGTHLRFQIYDHRHWDHTAQHWEESK